MDTAIQKAVPKTYISDLVKLDFSNNSNLKNDIQNRISKDIDMLFFNALNNITGNEKTGISFSEITLLALAYFYNDIFENTIKNEYYTITYVKGFFDAHNLTDYTAIHEIDVCYYRLKKAPYFNHCWLIIQTAWFFNSEHFGHHQHIDYLNYYIETGNKLPIEHYKYDKDYLQKKYLDIENAIKEKIKINGYSIVNHWYYGILFLICKELNLSVKNFKVNISDNREYNPMPTTSRQLRPLTPFKIIECDIKSAFPTFLDIETGANLKDHIYNNLMKSKKIKRGEAKILFNKVCNSGKYKSIEYTKAFFKDCGYTSEQCEKLINLTHNENRKFISFMTEYEHEAINWFMFANDLKRGARLHDAVLFIDNKVLPKILKVKPNCDFGIKNLNRPIIKPNLYFGNKRLKYAYVNSIPKGFNLITKQEQKKPNIKGQHNGFIIYENKFQYISASFNLNFYNEYSNCNLTEYEFFKKKCITMLNTLYFLNERKLKPIELTVILNHIRANSNFIFNVRAIHIVLNRLSFDTITIKVSKRDFDLSTQLNFKKQIEFLKAYNDAKKNINININFNDLFELLNERIYNNDYCYIDEDININGQKSNNVLVYAIIQKFNYLCTGNVRKPRKQVSGNPLYNNPIKRITVNSFSLNAKQRNAIVKRQIKSFEQSFKDFVRIVNNKELTKQLLLILSDITDNETAIKIKPNHKLINQLKTELMEQILKININCIDAGAMAFDMQYNPKIKTHIEPLQPKINIFNTDMTNSIFNHISMSDANSISQTFFNEYLNFHKMNKDQTTNYNKPIYNFPDIQF